MKLQDPDKMIIRRRMTETAVKESQIVTDPALFIFGSCK